MSSGFTRSGARYLPIIEEEIEEEEENIPIIMADPVIAAAKSIDECTKTIGQIVKVFGPLTDDILKDSEKCKQYINNLTTELQLLGYTHADDANNIRRIITALSKPGTASALWIEGARESITSIETLKASFIGTFCPASAEFDAQAELLNLMWKQDEETLEYYFNRYVNLIYRAYKDSGAAAEKKYIVHWLSGLPKNVLDRVLSGAQSADLSARQYMESAKRIYALSKATGRRQRSTADGKICVTTMEFEEPSQKSESGETLPNLNQADIFLSKKVDEMSDQIASLTSLIQQQKEDHAKQFQQKQRYDGGGRNKGGHFGRNGGGGYNGNQQGGYQQQTGKYYDHRKAGNYRQAFACFRCKDPNHRVAECPYPPQPNNNMGPSYQQQFMYPPYPYPSSYHPNTPPPMYQNYMPYPSMQQYPQNPPPSPHSNQFQQQQTQPSTGGHQLTVWQTGQSGSPQSPHHMGNGAGVQQRPSL